MKKLITALVSCILLLSTALVAVPASPALTTVKTADGSQLTIRVNGDEFCNWLTTSDGYTLLKDSDGNYQYAVTATDGSLKLSGVKAVERDSRSNAESQFLKSLPLNAGYNPVTISQIRRNSVILKTASGSKMGGFPTTGSPKLLMILANFSDTGTSYSQDNFNNYMNQVNYNGTGSFRDYYTENSYGKLTVNTTVQAWVKLTKTKSYYGPEAKWAEFVRDAVNAANAAGVDFTQYDNNGDGIVDGVAVIHQGLGQEETGNTSDIWSHNWDLRNAGITLTVDGKTVGPYTCQPEKSGSGMASIGVMCHEFGHNLGLPDFYDTDYSTGGSYNGTANWDMMASGSYNNSGKTPAHHNAWSKNFLGWANVTTLSAAGTITVKNSVANPDFFRINTPTTNEYFLLENRQKTGFDAALPGSGLVVYHVDGSYISSHMNANNINATSHQGLYPKVASSTINTAGCPFPGSGNKTSFTDATTPNSKSWAGANTAKPMTNIAVSNGIVTFDFMGGGTTNPAPTIAITAPANNSSYNLESTINVAATAAEVVKSISKVDFYVDNALKFTDTAAPYEYAWNTTGSTTGAHIIKAIVTSSYNTTATTQVTVNLTQGGTGTTTTLISEGFEGTTFPPTGWTLGSTGAWSKGSEAYAGTKCARALYKPSGTKILNAPSVKIPAGATTTLEFWWKNDDINAKVAKQDTTFCEISINGTTWTRLGLLSPASVQSTYGKFTANVSAYTGTAVKIRWRYKTNGTTSAWGIGLDEVKLTTVSTKEEQSETVIPSVAEVISNYPNPFNPSTTITFALNSAADVKLAVYNAKGELVKVLTEGLLNSGTHSVTFDGSTLNSGMYFYTLSAPNKVMKGKMLLVK